MTCILAIDQGTTSTRAIVFDAEARPLISAQRELPQIYPQDGWVEHDPEEIWQATVDVCRQALAQVDRAPAAIGITNQRETTVLWERATGRPIHNAIVWQDRRTADHCRRLLADGLEDVVRERTGLLIDPYFSATKIAWMLDHVDGARTAAERGELAFGTVDSWLLWRLTAGRVHATDATNAARTSLFNIHALDWDEDLLRLFRIPRALLPKVLDNAADFGLADPALFGRALPIAGMAGDQQAAAIGQACFASGMAKSTYGTGCFILMNTGETPVRSRHRLLSTLAWRLGGRPTYALEGSIFVAGAALQWLRDGLRLIGSAGDSEALAAGLGHNAGVYLVPAFTGLGAPYWDPNARGAIFGLTRATGIAEIVRAALEAVVYQTRDLVAAMEADAGMPLTSLRVDGGMVVNGWLMQFLADLIEIDVERPAVTETTALGAAYLAGLHSGVYGSFAEVAAHWRRDALFRPAMGEDQRGPLVAGWQKAVARVREGVGGG